MVQHWCKTVQNVQSLPNDQQQRISNVCRSHPCPRKRTNPLCGWCMRIVDELGLDVDVSDWWEQVEDRSNEENSAASGTTSSAPSSGMGASGTTASGSTASGSAGAGATATPVQATGSGTTASGSTVADTVTLAAASVRTGVWQTFEDFQARVEELIRFRDHRRARRFRSHSRRR